jgi:ABC-type antimicrobial peptide transport system permease subunit
MLKNYFKTAWRSLARGKGFSLINIVGLVVGMAGATLILLWLANEVSFDRFHVNKDRLYQVYAMTEIPGEKHATISVVSQPLGPALKQDFPDVENFSRVQYVDHFLLSVGDKRLSKVGGRIVDPAFLDMFSFPLVAGSKAAQLGNLNSITITENLARKLFGSVDVVGKTIRIDNADNFTVTGVLKDPPVNTRFTFDYLLPFDYLRKIGRNNDNWVSNNIVTYVLLKPQVDVVAFNAKIRNLSRIKAGMPNIWVHFVYPLEKWHLYSDFDDGVPTGGRIETVRTFGIIAGFILLIACINFMNLSTARSEQRAKEVGIRKVAGAGRGLLIGQFIAEAFLTACIAGGLALLVVALVLPAFCTLIGQQLSLPFGSGLFWVGVLGFLVFTSLLAGSYPAFYLSSFKPVGIFRKQFKKHQTVFSPRRILVVVQFTFAIVLIVSTLIVRQQVQYAEDRDTGYDKHNLIYVDFVGDIEKHYDLIKQELLSSGVAVSVSKNSTGMSQGGGRTWGFRWVGEAPRDTVNTFTFYITDANLVKTAGMQLLAGRDIDVYAHPADSFAVLLNEAAVRTMGFKHPVGSIINQPYNNIHWHVVGVVKDYVESSPYEATPPVVIEGPGGNWFNTMHIKFNPAHSTAASLTGAEAILKKYNPAYPFDYQFVDQEYATNFDNEQRTKTMAALFAALAVFISCLGLFGLSAYVAESRTKEIGVRKVLGASVPSIAGLLSLDFVRLVLISVLIGSPLAWYGMNRWLGDYTYRITIGWGIFVMGGLLAIVIALVTVSFQAIRAANANPVKSLRSE